MRGAPSAMATRSGRRHLLALVLSSGVLLAACTSASQPGRTARSTTTRSHASVASTVPPPTSTSSTSSTAGTPSTLAPGAAPCGTSAAPPARYQHVVWIFMENHTWSSVIGTASAPYLTTLAHKCGTDTAYADVGSPSLPNYLGATSGSTQGIADDGDPSAHSFAVDNLFRQVRASGGTERSFVESMPTPCTLVSQGAYAAKHNPAIYFDGTGPGGNDRVACHADDLPFANFSAVLAGGVLPTFTFIAPNICNDMHDCSVATGDRWLATWVPRILATPSYRTGSTALFVVWDEPTPVANLVVAPSVRPGTRADVAVTHYSLLRATEQMLGLPLLGRAATATSLRQVFGI